MRESDRHLPSEIPLCSTRGPSASLTCLALALFLPALLSGQTPAPSTSPAHKPSPAKEAVAAPQPPTPDWPINEQPKPAAVTWSKDLLSIDASNSSLQQILANVASATGTSVDGATKDERIFGTFGPAPARDVLADLLQGTNYNVMMIGDQGQGVPRQIILSTRSTNKPSQGTARSASEENDDDLGPPETQYDPPPQPPQQQAPPQQVMRPGFNPGVNPQNPQQPREQVPQAQQPANPPN
jgi:hypothetical protein